MRLKEILFLALLPAVSAGALEERLVLALDPGASSAGTAVSASLQAALAPGSPRIIGDWTMSGAVAKTGFRGGRDFALAHAAYAPDPSADLLLHLDRPVALDETGNWDVAAGRAFAIDSSRALIGEGSGSFRGPDSTLSLAPRAGSLFARDSRFRDFTIEFWLYPANAENGEVVLLWQSVRKMPGGVLPQQISVVVAGGRLMWSFVNFFARPDAARPEDAANRVELRARSPLVPRAWSHHLLRFDGDTGLVEYLADGQSEAVAYATASGREGGTVREPAVGAASPLRFCPEYAGLAEELRLSRRFVEKPSLRPYGKDSALVLSPVADLGYGHSSLIAIDARIKAPGNTGVELSYRIADEWTNWRSESPPWIPFRPGERLSDDAKGRYVQVRAELFPDGTGRLSPVLSSVTLRFEPDELPPPPARLIAYPKDGAVELRWTKVPEADLAGYLVYYGESPGEYFGTGADQGPSPIDAGNTTTITLTGIPNGKLLYFAVAAYDAAAGAAPGGAASRAGEFSQETAARPSRTAK